MDALNRRWARLLGDATEDSRERRTEVWCGFRLGQQYTFPLEVISTPLWPASLAEVVRVAQALERQRLRRPLSHDAFA